MFSFRKEMAKRKMDCNLDDIVMEYLKKVKFEKTSKMFGNECSDRKDQSELLEKFIKFMKHNEEEKENRGEDDLGFEINFGAFEPMKKVGQFRQFFLRKCLNPRI